MTTFLNILFWAGTAFGAVATVLTLIRLTVGDAARGKAKPGARASAWRLLCYSLGLMLGPAGDLFNGPAAWVPISLSLCLVGFAFIWDVRLQFGRASRA
jgi:hypothetical protein